VDNVEAIPPITDEMGRSWEQPDRRGILVDDTYAVMTQRDFDALHEYSGTMPSGVYPGKMWKRHDGAYDVAFRRAGGVPEWLLCWYGFSDKGEGYCSINSRKVLIV